MIDIRDIIGDVPFKIAQEQNVAWAKNALEKHNGLDLIIIDDQGNNITRRKSLYFPLDGKVIRASYHYKDSIHSFGNRTSYYCKIDGREVLLYYGHQDGINPALLIPATPEGVVLNNGFPACKVGDFAGWMGGTGSVIPEDGFHLHLGILDYKTGVWLSVREFVDMGNGAQTG